MGTHRYKAAARLCLLLTVCAVTAGALLLRPEPAGAAGPPKRQFFFGPVYIADGQTVEFAQTNTGSRPTPPATVVFSAAITGEPFDTTPLPSLPPGVGNGRTLAIEGSRYTLVSVTFDRPAAGQQIPSPFAGTVVILDGSPPQVALVLHPEAAGAPGAAKRQFTYGPVYVTSRQSIDFLYTNTGTLPTPPATVVFSDALDGTVIATRPLESVPPGRSNGYGAFGTDRPMRVVLTFDRPAAGQRIPSPLVGAAEVIEASIRNPPHVQAILSRAR